MCTNIMQCTGTLTLLYLDFTTHSPLPLFQQQGTGSLNWFHSRFFMFPPVLNRTNVMKDVPSQSEFFFLFSITFSIGPLCFLSKRMSPTDVMVPTRKTAILITFNCIFFFLRRNAPSSSKCGTRTRPESIPCWWKGGISHFQ